MSNNYKQKVYSVLDGLTQADLDDYIKNRNINLNRDNMLKMLEKIRKPETHFQKIINDINDEVSKASMSYYNLGMAWVMSFILECLYDDKYKFADLKSYIHTMMDGNSELKEMVYDCMKDF